ncbi:unnamed protein product, partial [Iphiclides podalirius]
MDPLEASPRWLLRANIRGEEGGCGSCQYDRQRAKEINPSVHTRNKGGYKRAITITSAFITVRCESYALDKYATELCRLEWGDVGDGGMEEAMSGRREQGGVERSHHQRL